MYMYIIWYCLVSTICLILNILEYLFIKICKFNPVFFNCLHASLYSILGINNLLITNKINNNFENLSFKTFYKEYKFFNNANNSLLLNFLININLCKNLMLGFYNSELNLLANLCKDINSSRLNLNKIVSSLKIKSIEFSYNNIAYYKFNLINNFKWKTNVLVLDSLKSKVNSLWTIKYSPSNFLKYLILENVSCLNILYLRKNKVFNKGRYSRNRQYYRTGVYWCLYINIIAVIGIYFWFYRFTMNFGYLWWLLFIFISSFIVPKAIKYRLYNPLNLFNAIYESIVWISLIIRNIYFFILKLLLSKYFNL